MAYTIDTSKTHLPEAVELLTDSVLNPKFDLHIVKETVSGHSPIWSAPTGAAAPVPCAFRYK